MMDTALFMDCCYGRTTHANLYGNFGHGLVLRLCSLGRGARGGAEGSLGMRSHVPRREYHKHQNQRREIRLIDMCQRVLFKEGFQ
jgi:hypothetical protein